MCLSALQPTDLSTQINLTYACLKLILENLNFGISNEAELD